MKFNTKKILSFFKKTPKSMKFFKQYRYNPHHEKRKALNEIELILWNSALFSAKKNIDYKILDVGNNIESHLKI